MSRKHIGVVLSAVLLAVATPLLILALLHALDGKAQAAPPSYTKVSVPDFGQHSNNWCWVASAANSFWWYAHNTGGQQDELLGGEDHPWEAIDAISQKPPGDPLYDVCWYDANDLAQGAAAPVGYRELLSKIAATTFMDKVQDGVRDPDGADDTPGTVDDENTYCYSDGVEKWDYLIGLRDYVNLYGYHLAVHDIIDPARCGLHTGKLPVRPPQSPAPTNFRDPCVGADGGPPPGVTQVVRRPTFADYMTELSAGQDVLLWMEGSYPEETAHVVTGVGYDTTNPPAGKVGTVTIANPWTRIPNPNPPQPPWVLPPHDDTWNIADPSHNNNFEHDPVPPDNVSPYDVCTVESAGPADPGFQIKCGATTWTVVDMIFVSPVEPDKRVDHMSVDYLGNDYYPQTEEFDILKSQNKAISIHSFDVNPIAYTVDSDITFLADIPEHCEGRWIAQQGDTLHDYELYDPTDPLDQVHGAAHGGVKVPGDPTKDELPYLAAESAIHFQYIEPPEYMSDLSREFELHCYQDGYFTFTFYNKVEPKEPWVDPDLDNNWQRLDVTVYSVPNADIDIVTWVAPSPVGVPVENFLPEPIRVDEIKHNQGPQDAWSWASWRIDVGETPVVPYWYPEEGDACYNQGEQVDCTEAWTIDELQFYVELPVSSPVFLERQLNLGCYEPGGPYFITLTNEEWPIEMADPNEENNIRTFVMEVWCYTDWADKVVAAVTFDDGESYPLEGHLLPEPFPVFSGQTNRISVTSLDIIDEASYPPIDAYVSFLADIPKGCDGVWVYDEPNMYDLLTTGGWVDPLYAIKQIDGEQGTPGVKIPGDGDPYTIESDLHFHVADYYGPYAEAEMPLPLLRFFDLRCSAPGQYTFSFYNKIEPIGVYDPYLSNNWLKRDLVVNVGPAWDRDRDCHWNDFGGVDKETLHGSDPDNSAKTPEVCDGLDNDGDGNVDEGWKELGNPNIRDCEDSLVDSDGDEIMNDVETDDDDDKFSDSEEVWMATDPLDDCRDDATDQAWPLDMNNDGIAKGDDVLYFAGKLKAKYVPPPDPNYTCRVDLNRDKIIKGDDVLRFSGHLKEKCTNP